MFLQQNFKKYCKPTKNRLNKKREIINNVEK